LDQYYVQNPHELFEKPTSDLVIDLESNVILEAHLQCAALEMPVSSEDAEYFGPQFQELCDAHLVKDKDGWYVSASHIDCIHTSF
jgi:DEAD/DEAH box helicase domain-containing protein